MNARPRRQSEADAAAVPDHRDGARRCPTGRCSTRPTTTTPTSSPATARSPRHGDADAERADGRRSSATRRTRACGSSRARSSASPTPRARGKATREELSGSTITLSSLGPMGGITSTPVINRPEVAIIAVNKVEEKLVVVDGEIEIRKRMNLSLSLRPPRRRRLGRGQLHAGAEGLYRKPAAAAVAPDAINKRLSSPRNLCEKSLRRSIRGESDDAAYIATLRQPAGAPFRYASLRAGNARESAEYSVGRLTGFAKSAAADRRSDRRHRPAARAAPGRRAVRADRLHRQVPRPARHPGVRGSGPLHAGPVGAEPVAQQSGDQHPRHHRRNSGDAFFEPRVSIYQDGVSISKPRGAYVELFDIDRVEVSKGPQSTLYGRGALIGAINIVQAKPDLSDTFGMVRGEYGNFDYMLGEAMLNAPLGANAGVRIAGRYKKRDGYVDNLLGGDGFPVGRDRRRPRQPPLQAVRSDHRRHHRQLPEGHAERHRVQVAGFPPDRSGHRRSARRHRHPRRRGAGAGAGFDGGARPRPRPQGVGRDAACSRPSSATPSRSTRSPPIASSTRSKCSTPTARRCRSSPPPTMRGASNSARSCG